MCVDVFFLLFHYHYFLGGALTVCSLGDKRDDAPTSSYFFSAVILWRLFLLLLDLRTFRFAHDTSNMMARSQTKTVNKTWP